MLLAIDTCFSACSAAVLDVAADRILAGRFEAMDKGHAEALGPMVEAVLAEAAISPRDLTSIAVTFGPGSFTGLRIGLSYAKGLALALHIPLIGLDSLLATLAPHIGATGPVAIAHVAGGSGLIYWALFEGADGRALTQPQCAAAGEIAAALDGMDLRLGGTAVLALKALLPRAVLLEGSLLPDASQFARQAALMPKRDAPVEPLYLRPADARPSVAKALSEARVRSVEATDLEAIAAIHSQCFAKGWNAGDIRTMLQTPGAGAMVVELGGSLYGFVQFQWAAGEAEIYTLCVAPNYRRQHFGRDLVEGLARHLRERGTTKLHLEVAENNQAARGLYERAGFSVTGLRRNYYADGQNAVMMARTLAA